jgi:hypothetical protein
VLSVRDMKIGRGPVAFGSIGAEVIQNGVRGPNRLIAHFAPPLRVRARSGTRWRSAATLSMRTTHAM